MNNLLPTEQSQSLEVYWQSFPHMEAFVGTERARALSQIEKTCHQLDVIVKSGTKQEAARAQAAIDAYARMLELSQHLASLRDSVCPASNKASQALDK